MKHLVIATTLYLTMMWRKAEKALATRITMLPVSA